MARISTLGNFDCPPKPYKNLGTPRRPTNGAPSELALPLPHPTEIFSLTFLWASAANPDFAALLQAMVSGFSRDAGGSKKFAKKFGRHARNFSKNFPKRSDRNTTLRYRRRSEYGNELGLDRPAGYHKFLKNTRTRTRTSTVDTEKH